MVDCIVKLSEQNCAVRCNIHVTLYSSLVTAPMSVVVLYRAQRTGFTLQRETGVNLEQKNQVIPELKKSLNVLCLNTLSSEQKWNLCSWVQSRKSVSHGFLFLILGKYCRMQTVQKFMFQVDFLCKN